MSLIVAARFDTFDYAQEAANVLLDQGVSSNDIHTFYVEPPNLEAHTSTDSKPLVDPKPANASRGALSGAALLGVAGAMVGALIGFSVSTSLIPVVVGAGVGAYLGSLMGSLSALGQQQSSTASIPIKETDSSVRSSGVLLAVRVAANEFDRIAMLLHQHGGAEVERARGHWKAGKWVDFDPLAAQEEVVP